MAKKEISRYVVTLYASDRTIITSHSTSTIDDARVICRTELAQARSLKVSKERQDGRVVARYRGHGPVGAREALVRAW